jgi:hypothetical protein
MSLLNNNKGKGKKDSKNQQNNNKGSKFIPKPKAAGPAQRPHKAGGTRGS